MTLPRMTAAPRVSDKPRPIPRLTTETRLLVYVAAVAGLGATSLAAAPTWSAPAEAWLPALVVLTALSVATEFASVPLRSGGRFSMATIPHVATILLVPAPFGAISIGLSVLVEQAVRRVTPLKLTFNVSGMVLTASAASWAMGFTGSVLAPGSTGHALLPVPLAVVAAIYFGINAALTGVVLAIVEQRALKSMLRQNRSTLIAELAATAMGAQFALIWTIEPVLVVVIGIPAWVIAQSFGYIHRLDSETRASVRSLAEIIDHRDATTYDHSSRVAVNAVRLARAVGLPEAEVELVEQAAAVHDVGKIGVPDRVLLKPGPLDADEQEAMRRHSDLGSRILTGFQLFRPGAAIVRHHHEQWDGHGYPDGLAGEAIPVGARVVAVVDAFDAMTSHRPYRRALPREEALRRIAEGAGRQWDPRIVAIFLDLEASRPTPIAAPPEASGRGHAVPARAAERRDAERRDSASA
jgi:putative nucleotidyltransferase with HDIG domain